MHATLGTEIRWRQPREDETQKRTCRELQAKCQPHQPQKDDAAKGGEASQAALGIPAVEQRLVYAGTQSATEFTDSLSTHFCTLYESMASFLPKAGRAGHGRLASQAEHRRRASTSLRLDLT